MKMTNEEAIQELIDASHREAKFGDKDNHYSEILRRIDAFDMGIKALEKQENNFNEVVDFFNDIMDTFYKELTPTEVQAWHEGYVDALENVYDWLKEQPRVPTKVLMQLKESIKILGGGLNGEE